MDFEVMYKAVIRLNDCVTNNVIEYNSYIAARPPPHSPLNKKVIQS